MLEGFTQPKLIGRMKEKMGELTDSRTGKNTQYKMEDAGMGAFSVFFTQCASFLEHQETLKKAKGKRNAESIFGVMHIPSANQIRNMLDPVTPEVLNGMYREIFNRLEKAEIIKGMRSFSNKVLIALDGTEYFSSKKIQCDKCSHRTLKNEEINHYHGVITPVIVQSGNEHVICLEPEFIIPQDGKEKQDCEIEAAKRWVRKHGAYYTSKGVILLGDDLFSRQPFCQLIKHTGLHFILVCKPDSHEMLYKTVKFLENNGTLSTYAVRGWNGKQGEIYTYRYANDLPLNGEPNAMLVNWCELTITDEETGAFVYRNAFVTDFDVLETTVEAIARDGRSRWKIENENNNVLKTKGYHLEHNFGHGSQFLASFFLSLNLLAFLFHTVLNLVDMRYKLLRQILRKRELFFHDINALLRYIVFNNWDHLLDFMITGLEIEIPSSA
ncbi:MAG: ISNCY family transposase [Candidatus Peregrinibacteria bacterium]